MSFKERLENLYPAMPGGIQNLMISGQGWLFRRQRYSGNYPRMLAEVCDRAKWSADRLTVWQIETARDFLSHASRTSPYWRSRFSESGFDPANFSAPEDIRRAPILEKDDLRSRTAEIASLACRGHGLIGAHTSGTTGTPISVAFTRSDMQMRMAYLHRMFALFGIPPLARSVRFSGRTLFPNAASKRSFWRMNYPMNQMLMSSYDLHPDTMQDYVDKLDSYCPVLIDGYPSSIYVIARFINSRNQSGRISPRAVITTAETLEEYQREEISIAFGGCPVINQYASSEGAPFITQDTDGAMVVNTDTGIFEFVHPGTDEPAQPGDVAEMLLTSFTTHAYPLIRYRIGDTVILPNALKSSRIWDMPVVEKILGRQEDILYTPERGFVGRLDPVFKKSPSTIIESQVIQTAPMSITLKVVPDRKSGFHHDQLEGVKNELKSRLGNVSIVVEEVESLPRGANGKVRAVVGLDKSIK